MTRLSCDAVVVGAGFAGAATAYHLVRLGLRDVVVLAQEPLAGVHASGRNAGMIREAVLPPAIQPLARTGAGHHRGRHRRCRLLPQRRRGGHRRAPARRTLSPDGSFVVGRDPMLQGFVWCAGLGGHGVIVGPPVGRLAAEAALGRPSSPAHSPERFVGSRRPAADPAKL